MILKDIIKEIVKVYGPGSVVDYFGLTPQNERDGNREKFQSDPKCRFLVGTPATGADMIWAYFDGCKHRNLLF